MKIPEREMTRLIFRRVRLLICLHLLFSLLNFMGAAAAIGKQTPAPRRDITVDDVIRMTNLADGEPSHFSPDGKRFLVLLRRGKTLDNTNELALVLFQTAEVFHSPKPDVVLTMASSCNQDAKTDLIWLQDSQRVAFLGEDSSCHSQVYILDIRSRKLQKRTAHRTSITEFAITGDGHKLAFKAEAANGDLFKSKQTERHGVVVSQPPRDWRIYYPVLDSLLEGELPGSPKAEFFSQKEAAIPNRITNVEYEKTAKSLSQQHIGEKPPIQVEETDDLNAPPALSVTDPKTNQKAVLLNLNPDFAKLNFGAVRTIEWDVDGVKAFAGLFLPSDYVPGQRYPLVVQTHGFRQGEFSMTGLDFGGYAARPLASHGVMVLQCCDYNRKDEDLFYRGRSPDKLDLKGERDFNVRAFESVIDYLAQQGLVDPQRVGIAGFSRTVWIVGYMLTHPTHTFKAAMLTDGIDAGYVNYILYLTKEFEIDNGGGSPFGEKGLDLWLKESPTFNLDKVETPVCLEGHGRLHLLVQWEWFAGLVLQNKPVDYLWLPDANHEIDKPWEREASMQTFVDWFCFWLKNEEDPDPAKVAEYTRWRELRKLQAQNELKGSNSRSSAN